MIDRETAEQIVENYFTDYASKIGLDDEIVVLKEHTIEKEYGWVFFYDTRKHLETGNVSYALIGGGPIVVERKDGSLYFLGSAWGLEEAIRRYEERRAQDISTGKPSM